MNRWMTGEEQITAEELLLEFIEHPNLQLRITTQNTFCPVCGKLTESILDVLSDNCHTDDCTLKQAKLLLEQLKR
jgi:hypothetical protein